MNDPELARKRRKAVKRAKEEGIDKDDAFRWVREHYGQFEGHMLENTIDRVYDDG